MESKQAAKGVTVSKRWLLAVSLLFYVFCLLFTIRVVSAHAQLVAAEPANGITLRRSPDELHLTFSENLGASSKVIVIGENFLRVTGVEVREIVFNEIFVSVPKLDPGVYTVQYDVVSADDHPISGSYEFAVGTAANWNMLWMLVLVVLLIFPIIYFGRSRNTPSFWD